MSHGALEAMGSAGRSYYLKNMSGSVAVLQFERIFREVLANAVSPSRCVRGWDRQQECESPRQSGSL
jgi:hypothetical protein